MREQDLDSSKNPYLKENESNNYTKQVNWEMAIGLQKVDELNPSSYLINLSNEYIKGDLTIEEVEKNLKNYYIEHEQKKQINKHEKEYRNKGYAKVLLSKIGDIVRDIFKLNVSQIIVYANPFEISNSGDEMIRDSSDLDKNYYNFIRLLDLRK